MGSRSKARGRAVEVLYAADRRDTDLAEVLRARVAVTEQEAPPIADYTVALVEAYAAHAERIDELLVEYAQGWTPERMPPVDRAILRLGLAELLYLPDVPDPVVIDEAVQLATSLSTDDSPRFVNGVLGRISGIAGYLRAGD